MKRFSVYRIGFALGLCAISGAFAADRPPRDLHLVGDHWTAWNPPVPPEGVQVYTIVRGDTLWDLANRFLGNPYLWPQIWELNQYILDAHWIYPGDPLAIGPAVATAGAGAADEGAEYVADSGLPGDEGAGETEDTTPVDGVQTSAAASSPPQALGSESDIYCTGYIGEMEETFPLQVIGSEFENLTPLSTGRAKEPGEIRAPTVTAYGVVPGETAKYGLAAGDVVYLNGGRTQGLTPGALFTAVKAADRIVHPLFGDVLGRLYRYLGRVRVLSVQEDTAIAEVVHSCDPIEVGTTLKPFEEEPVPLGRRSGLRPVNFPATPQELEGAPSIVFAKDGIVTLGQDNVAFIDRGEEENVTPGDVYTIYRMNRPGLPPLVIGELAVLSVQRRTSLTKIIESRGSIFLGDRLQLKN